MGREKYLSKSGKTYRNKGWITKQKKELVEKHPHSSEYFLFKRAGQGYNWFVRV